MQPEPHRLTATRQRPRRSSLDLLDAKSNRTPSLTFCRRRGFATFCARTTMAVERDGVDRRILVGNARETPPKDVLPVAFIRLRQSISFTATMRRKEIATIDRSKSSLGQIAAATIETDLMHVTTPFAKPQMAPHMARRSMPVRAITVSPKSSRKPSTTGSVRIR